jgi:predicted nucleotidyltransferase
VAVMTTVTIDLAEHVIAILRAHETELRQAGIMRLSLFGSVARGEERADSDVDLAAELDPQAKIGLIALSALERRLQQLLGRKVDVLPEPVEKPRLRAAIEQDRRRVF